MSDDSPSTEDDKLREEQQYAVQIRRLSVFSGVVAAVALYFFSRSLQGSLEVDDAYRSVVFDDTGSWPNWLFNFWPLEMLSIGVSFGFMMWLVLNAANKKDKSTGGRWFPLKLLAGVFVGFGCFMMAMGTAFSGWYAGIEFFFVGGTFALGMLACLAALVVVSIVIGYLCHKLWRALQPTWVGRMLHGMAGYLNADDVGKKNT